MEIPRTLKLGQLERSYLSSLLWKLWEEQAEMVQMTKLIPALFRVWTKDMRTRIQCQRGEFAGIETRVSVCRSILYQFGWVQNNARFTSGELEWIFKLNNPIQVLHERRVGTRDVLRTLWIRTTFCGITRLSIRKKKMEIRWTLHCLEIHVYEFFRIVLIALRKLTAEMNFRSQASLVSPLSLALSVTENRRDVIVDYLAILFSETFNFVFFVFVFLVHSFTSFASPILWNRDRVKFSQT